MADEPEIAVAGMTLTQYAFVRAGLADGLALEALLGFLKLDPGTWEVAEEPWEERILDAVGEVDVALLAQLDARMAEARVHWTRRVRPLDEELPAWFAFLKAWQGHAEPAEYLERARLGAADLAYLHRLWAERVMRDPKLREEALALLAKDLGEPPAVTVEPPRLVREERPGAASGENATQDLALVKRPTLPFEEGEPRPMPPSLAVPLPRRKRPRATAPGIAETAFLRAPPTDAPLPFWPVELSAPLPEPQPAPAAESAPQLDATTAPEVVPPAVAPAAGASRDAPTLVLAPSFQVPEPGGEPSSYSPVSLPTTAEGAAGGSGRRPDDGPPGRRPSTLRLEVIEPSPFDDDPAAPDPAPAAVPAGDTAPLSQATDLSAPLPFAPAERTIALVPRVPEETVAVEVATGVIKPLSAAFGPLPRLSLEEHARLYAELTTTPEQTAQILDRYGLTPDSLKTEDAFWQAEFGRDPKKRAAWHRACAEARAKRPTNQEPR